ncbi:MAG TPA: enoyl-CoA hydratase/isomerase family protein [Deltaproteobacteria bacterium]|nr:enoyl-CoA hydratase/isomerase family protein [Deltaproteobacteria bacterium]
MSNESEATGDLSCEIDRDFIATLEIRRPPANFFDHALIRQLADTLERLDSDDRCRVAILCSEGKHFCAGADFGGEGTRTTEKGASAGERPAEGHLYDEAVRLFATKTPVVAAVQGAAIGGGLGLALFADFRVATPESRFSANFARLGFHQGFGLSVTLPDVVGIQATMDLLYTGRRVPGEEAFAMGLCDRLVPADRLRQEARAWAVEIATSAPLAIRSIRETLRGDLAERIRVATDHEKIEQERLQATDDFREGVRAMGERRRPEFKGR